MYTNMISEGPPTGMNLQLAPAHNVAMNDENWCQKLFNLLHFPDLNPNCSGNLNNMKLDLNVSIT